ASKKIDKKEDLPKINPVLQNEETDDVLVLRFVMTNEEEKVKELIKKNPDLLKKEYKDGDTLLHWAAYYGFENIIDVLINEGASLEVTNKLGTPLQESLRVGVGLKAAIKLLERGANPNLIPESGLPPLESAIYLKEGDK